jgi:hypothetical protein
MATLKEVGGINEYKVNGISAANVEKYNTHTHTHTYIYIYIYNRC